MDPSKNFAYTTVATAPSPASSGTSLVVTAGQGALLPATPFNATVWPTGVQPLASNAEVVRVTAIATDTLTITRQAEGSASRSILVGDQLAATITSKMLGEPTVLDVPTAEVNVAADNTLIAGDELDLSNDVELILEGEVVFA